VAIADAVELKRKVKFFRDPEPIAHFRFRSYITISEPFWLGDTEFFLNTLVPR
jgi:hypothetical protein